MDQDDRRALANIAAAAARMHAAAVLAAVILRNEGSWEPTDAANRYRAVLQALAEDDGGGHEPETPSTQAP